MMVAIHELDYAQGSGTSMFAAIQTAAPSLRMEVSPINMRDAGEIERAIAAFAHAPNGGFIVTPSGPADFHRDLIIGWQSSTSCRRSTRNASTSLSVAWSRMGPIR